MSQEKRMFLAMGLMLAVVMVYQYFFFTPPPESERAPKPAAEAPAPKPEVAAPPTPAPAPVPAPARAATTSRPPQRLVPVETPLYRAVVSSEGGKLQELTLKYRGEKPLVIVGELGPVGLLVDGEVLSMRLDAERLTLDRQRPRGTLTLDGQDGDLRVKQTLAFDADTYAVDVRLHVENRGTAPRAVTLALAWATRQAWREIPEKFQGQYPTEIVWSAAGGLERVENLCEVPLLKVKDGWIGTGSVWYMAGLMPRTEGFALIATAEDKKVCDAKGKDPVGRATVAVQAAPTLAPGASWEGRVSVYAGPKEYDRLRAVGLEGAINFGGFPVPRRWGGLPMEWFGVPILVIMNWVYRYVGNYGVAIILLTIVTRVLFYPLTVKSMKSMKAMQALQPKINELRSKYKNDPQRLQRETMELYRANKVNPLGGCLPMVAQVPIFYALYLALSVSVELQNAAFLCFGRVFGADVWICDLASQDPTYVMPILMGITMFVQQKLTPMGGDPRQARIMLIVMPIMFTAMFINLPSGLVLYWTVSNVLQIAQQKYTNLPQPTAKGARG